MNKIRKGFIWVFFTLALLFAFGFKLTNNINHNQNAQITPMAANSTDVHYRTDETKGRIVSSLTHTGKAMPVGSEVSFVAIPKEGFIFDAWYELTPGRAADNTNTKPPVASGHLIVVSDSPALTVRVRNDTTRERYGVTYIASFIPLDILPEVEFPLGSVTHKLTYTVESTDDSASILGFLPVSYRENTKVSLVAVESITTKFIGWYDSNGLVSISPTYTFRITANTHLTAKFEKREMFNVTFEHTNGQILGDVAGLYEKGTVLQFFADSNTGYKFTGWNINGNTSPNINVKVTVNSDLIVKAIFDEDPSVVKYKLNFEADANGTVSSTHHNDENILVGTLVSVIATPDANYVFDSWQITKGSEIIDDVSNPNLFFEMTDNVELTAKFVVDPALTTHELIYSNTGAGDGVILSNFSSNSDVLLNQKVTLIAQPDPGNLFKRWEITAGDAIIGDVSTNQLTFIMTENVTVNAVFEKDPLAKQHEFKYTNVENGNVLSNYDSGEFILHNTPVFLYAVPNEGYLFDRWEKTGDGIIVDVTQAYLEFDITTDVTFKPLYKKDPAAETHRLVFDAGTNGEILSNYTSGEELVKNTNVRLIALPNPGYLFDSWDIICGESMIDDVSNVQQIFDITGNVNVVANFIADPLAETFKLVYTTGANGNVLGNIASGSDVVLYTTVAIMAEPNSGFIFKKWNIISGTATISNIENNINLVFDIEENIEIEAVFALDPTSEQFELKFSSNGNGSVISNFNSNVQVYIGESVTLYARPAVGFIFVNWEIIQGTISIPVGTDQQVTFNMSERIEVIANFIADPEYATYELLFETGANGSVLSNFTSGEILVKNTSVTLVAIPNPGFLFKEWEVTKGETITGKTNYQLIFDITEKIEVKAIFVNDPAAEQFTYKFSTDTNGQGFSNFDNDTQVVKGTTIALFARPNPGFLFDKWVVVRGTLTIVSQTNPSLRFDIFDDVELQATFRNDPTAELFELNFRAAVNGSIISGNNDGDMILRDSRVTMVATPNPGFLFDKWLVLYGTTSVTDLTNSTLVFIMTEEVSVIATFKEDPAAKMYNLSIMGNDGSVVGDAQGDYVVGTAITLTAKPNFGYRFVEWKVNDVVVSSNETFTFIMNEYKVVVAIFELIPTFQLDFSNLDDNGTIDADFANHSQIQEGTAVVLIARPKAGFLFDSWTVSSDDPQFDGILNDSTLRFTMNKNLTIIANYIPAPFEVEGTAWFLAFAMTGVLLLGTLVIVATKVRKREK